VVRLAIVKWLDSIITKSNEINDDIINGSIIIIFNSVDKLHCTGEVIGEAGCVMGFC
jgi:hypothetical protein